MSLHDRMGFWDVVNGCLLGISRMEEHGRAAKDNGADASPYEGYGLMVLQDLRHWVVARNEGDVRCTGAISCYGAANSINGYYDRTVVKHGLITTWLGTVAYGTTLEGLWSLCRSERR